MSRGDWFLGFLSIALVIAIVLIMLDGFGNREISSDNITRTEVIQAESVNIEGHIFMSFITLENGLECVSYGRGVTCNWSEYNTNKEKTND